MSEVKSTRRWLAILTLAGSILLSAVVINWRATLREVIAECTWKVSALITLFLGSISTGAEEGMHYLNNNSTGVSALCTIIGLAASIYFQWKSSNKKRDDVE